MVSLARIEKMEWEQVSKENRGLLFGRMYLRCCEILK